MYVHMSTIRHPRALHASVISSLVRLDPCTYFHIYEAKARPLNVMHTFPSILLCRKVRV